MSFFFVSSFVVQEYWEDEDIPVIHMGMIMGMQGVSISMQPLKGDNGHSSNNEKEASKQYCYELCRAV